MNKQRYWAVLAISYARASIMEQEPGRKRWLMGRATRYMDRSQAGKCNTVSPAQTVSQS